MNQSDVTLSPTAVAACSRLGITERDVRAARAGNTSERELPQWLLVYGELPDGRSIVMSCRHDRPWHVHTVRPG